MHKKTNESLDLLPPCWQLLCLFMFEKMSIECKIQNDSESLEKKTPGPLLLQDRQWWRSVIIHAEISNEISTEISIDYLTPISTDHQGRQLERRPCFFWPVSCVGMWLRKIVEVFAWCSKLCYHHPLGNQCSAVLDATDIKQSINMNLQLKAWKSPPFRLGQKIIRYNNFQ